MSENKSMTVESFLKLLNMLVDNGSLNKDSPIVIDSGKLSAPSSVVIESNIVVLEV